MKQDFCKLTSLFSLRRPGIEAKPQRDLVVELQRLTRDCVAEIARERALMAAHAKQLHRYRNQRDRQEAIVDQATLNRMIALVEDLIEAGRKSLAELEMMLSEQRAALAKAVGPPVPIFAIQSSSFKTADGWVETCGHGETHRVLPPIAATPIVASVALAACHVAARRAKEACRRGNFPANSIPTVELGNPVGFADFENGEFSHPVSYATSSKACPPGTVKKKRRR